MGKDNYVAVEVAYATPDAQRIIAVQVATGTPPRQVIRESGLTDHFPEIDPSTCAIGVFGAQVEDTYGVQAGDRIEVYRSLQRDPRDARREMAARGLTIGGDKGRK
jgi:putative ubiquitin-RnfH superfamily antitoxin RatB of RatAB toxin-antitoxin module